MVNRAVAAGMALLAAIAGQAVAGNTYFVDIGSEAGGVGSEFSPMKTVAGGLLKLKGAGDELVIKKGLYVGSLEIRNLKGDQGNWIVIRGIREKVPPEEASQPAISPAQYAPLIKADKDNVLAIRDCSYVRVEGLVMTGAKQAGVFIENCDHVTLKDCDVVDNIASQVQAKAGRRITLENCELSGSILEHGCQFWASNQPMVRGCRIHHNSAAGVLLDGDKKVSGEGLIDGPIVENNIFYANGKLRDGATLPRDEKGREKKPVSLRFGAAAISGDGVERGMIRNNLVHHNWQGGIVLYRDDAARAGQHSRVLHNTIYLEASAYGLQLALMTQDTAFFNNVIVTGAAPGLLLGQGASRDLRSDYNVLFRQDNKECVKREKEDLTLDRWRELYRIDRNSIQFKPPFVDPDNIDPAKCDFQLKKEGQMTGRGQFQWEAPLDLLNRWRPSGQVTPGCYELNAVAENPNLQDNNPRGGRFDRGRPGQTPKETKPPDTKDPPTGPGPVILPPLE